MVEHEHHRLVGGPTPRVRVVVVVVVVKTVVVALILIKGVQCAPFLIFDAFSLLPFTRDDE